MSVCNFLGGFITLKALSKAAATWGPFLDLIGIAKANLLNMSIMVKRKVMILSSKQSNQLNQLDIDISIL